jgi:dTDP-4-dehydrorhamnose reductase
VIENKNRGEVSERDFRITPIAACEYPTPAKYPECSAMDYTKIIESFGVRPRPWKEALEMMIEKLHEE